MCSGAAASGCSARWTGRVDRRVAARQAHHAPVARGPPSTFVESGPRRPGVESGDLGVGALPVIAGWVLLLVSVAYVGLLFGVAWLGDRRRATRASAGCGPLVYSLALAVYCSSWTFYGAVGTAARTGLGFLPIYLGPLLMLVFGWRILERLVLVAREQSIVSIADFLSSRYGRAQALAALVALVALIAAIPYVALQFKAVGDERRRADRAPAGAGPRPLLADPALYVALMLALFAILFGTRQVDATEHHHGMMLAVALESLVKLVAFVAVGRVRDGLPARRRRRQRTRVLGAVRTISRAGPAARFPGADPAGLHRASICLPRQFHVAVVECQDVADMRPRALVVRRLSGADQPDGVADHARRAVGAGRHCRCRRTPTCWRCRWRTATTGLALAVYVGGFSAATGMVIVASAWRWRPWCSNDLVMPLLLAQRPVPIRPVAGTRRAGVVGAARRPSSRSRCSRMRTTAAPPAATAWRRSACWRSRRWRSSRRR